MKRFCAVLFLMIIITGVAYSDQLAYISKDQAERGAKFLKNEKVVLLFCGCCENDPKIYLRVKEISVKFTGYQNYYEIIITGTTAGGELKSVEADLAYVHVNREGKAVTVGKILGLECDPCASEFPWNSDIRDFAGQK